jgi:hypothetical protein
MSDLLRINRRINYLEEKINTIQVPEKVAVHTPDTDTKQQLSYIQQELETLKKVMTALQVRMETRMSDLEQNAATLLDRIVMIKEKLQPSFDAQGFELRLSALEHNIHVGIGSS